MKAFSGSVRLVWRQSMRGKPLPLALVLGVVIVGIFAAGCGKKENPAPVATSIATNATDATQQIPPTTQNAIPPATAPANPGPPQINLAASANADSDLSVLQQLNRAVIGFRMQNHRNPSSVEEAASAAGIQLPAPPPGKKYAFNNRGLVALVDISAK